MLQPFLIALQFLTRLPVTQGDWREEDVGRSIAWYPAIGLLLGGLLAGFGWILQGASPGVAAALLLALWVAVTGALHLDGLADSADAWLGGHGDRDRTLAIMKDPHRGAAAVVAVAVVLIAKFAALEAAIGNGAWLCLAVAPFAGRALVPVLFLTTPYVRPGGLGSALAAHLPRRQAIVSTGAAVVAILVLNAGRGLVIVAIAGLVFALLRWLMMARLQGTTGDTAGALIEIAEAAVLMAAVT
ncbi:adenosylcobinamide-GDP ribazoletransferase [Pelomicrobium sp. G1]|uniref:adenosylcobinamide-GDP ribazoletransferase n=1 Tax=unclassified Pelomicrobium TaxID=2815318 RepID=UPI003F75E6FE